MKTMLDSRSFTEPTQQLPTLPDRPEPTLEEREAAHKADRVALSQLLRETGWSVEQLNDAIATRAFPRPLGRLPQTTFGRPGEPVYQRSALRQWHAEFLAFVATVPATFR